MGTRFAARPYFEGGVLVEVAGGQGLPDGEVPGLVELPGLPGVEPGFDDPVFGVVPFVPGKLLHGDPLGLLPGVVFGSIVEGCVVLPGVGVFGELDPGIVDGIGVTDFPGGVAGMPGGVAGLPGGVAVPGA